MAVQVSPQVKIWPFTYVLVCRKHQCSFHSILVRNVYQFSSPTYFLISFMFCVLQLCILQPHFLSPSGLIPCLRKSPPSQVGRVATYDRTFLHVVTLTTCNARRCFHHRTIFDRFVPSRLRQGSKVALPRCKVNLPGWHSQIWILRGCNSMIHQVRGRCGLYYSTWRTPDSRCVSERCSV